MTTTENQRPTLAIGHVVLHARDVAASAEFYSGIGLRLIVKRPELAILELRGGTHLLLFQARDTVGPAPAFDLMVDDIAATWASFEKSGIQVTPIREDRISRHQMFEVTDPSGYLITVLSNHTEGRSV
jgi:catechol 2,3-dioxygenase-like lactoylglutathione lyase family enzyme